MEIREYTAYRESEIMALCASVGWTAYTRDPASLRAGFENSLRVLGAYENGALVGLVRAVGDGATVVFVQDVLVRPEMQRRGVGTALMNALLSEYRGVRQIELCADGTEEASAFYRSLGFAELGELGCRGYMLVRRGE
jgi:GNAT superfamily N-acetyltransferase